MLQIRAADVWKRFDCIEQSLCLRANRASRHGLVKRGFVVISRLGNGVFWYLLMLAFAVGSEQGAAVAAQMAVAGIAGLLVYRQLKDRLVRERPYVSHSDIELAAAPLDRYSFPSGHTLHAVCFTTIALWHVPELAFVLVPFALLVGASRVVLGLHYPTDVLAGATLGAGIAVASLVSWGS